MGQFVDVFGQLNLPYSAVHDRQEQLVSAFEDAFGYRIEPDGGIFSVDPKWPIERVWTLGWRWVRQEGDRLVFSGGVRYQHLPKLRHGIETLAAWISSTWVEEEEEHWRYGGAFLVCRIDDISEVRDACWSIEYGQLVERDPPLIPGLGFRA